MAGNMEFTNDRRSKELSTSEDSVVLGQLEDRDSDSDSSDSSEYQYKKVGEKRKVAGNEEVSSLTLPRQKKVVKKRVGRKAAWPDECIDEIIDIICASDFYRKKLIFTNNKSFRNTEVFEKVAKEAIVRLEESGKEFPFTCHQIRTKFKSCVAICKKTAMLRQTASGIDNFIDAKGYSKWFKQLFQFVQSRDSCQPDLGIEPSAVMLCTDSPSTSCSASTNSAYPLSSAPVSTIDLFVPRKVRTEKSPKVLDVLGDAVKAFNRVMEQDVNREGLNFMKEENERSRQHDMKLMEMQMNLFKAVLSSPAQEAPINQAYAYSSAHPRHSMYQNQMYRQADNGEAEEMYSTVRSAFKNYSEL